MVVRSNNGFVSHVLKPIKSDDSYFTQAFIFHSNVYSSIVCTVTPLSETMRGIVGGEVINVGDFRDF